MPVISFSAFQVSGENKSTALTQLNLNLRSVRMNGPSFNGTPNLKRIVLSVQKLCDGSTNLDIGSRDPSHANIGVVL